MQHAGAFAAGGEYSERSLHIQQPAGLALSVLYSKVQKQTVVGEHCSIPHFPGY